MVLGRRGAGKTIFLARLYEALWDGCTLVDGRMSLNGQAPAGGKVSRLSCRALTGAADSAFMRTVSELRAGRWPAATVGSTYAELEVTHNGRTHVVTTLDYPGEVFRKAFVLDSLDPDADELREGLDRAAAAILLIDPSAASGGVEESREDSFGMTQAVRRIRDSPGGAEVPVAIVFTKCDLNDHFLREAGGPADFAKARFKQLFKGVQRTRVFPSAAVRIRPTSQGKSLPIAKSSPINVVEPLLYCIEQIEVALANRELAARQETVRREYETRVRAEDVEKDRAIKAWLLFGLAVILVTAVAVVGTVLYLRR